MKPIAQMRRDAFDTIVDEQKREEARDAPDPRDSLAGLALSGGGIRSATFALGVLQALGEKKLLWMFDYLSTVSGGGYAGAWWSAWLARPEQSTTLAGFPADERLEPDRFPAIMRNEKNVADAAPPNSLPTTVPDGSRSAWLQDPIHHLRLFSNYLTPRKGVLSADTWRAITTISRNIILTWVILLPLLVAGVVLVQVYFAGHRDSAFWFACSRPDSLRSDTTWRTPARGQPGTSIREITRLRIIRLDTTHTCLNAILVDAARLDDVITSHKLPVASGASVRALGLTHGTVLRQRLQLVLNPVLAGVVLLTAVTLAWMIYGNGSIFLTLVGVGVVIAGTVLFAQGSGGNGGGQTSLVSEFAASKWLIVALVGAAVVLAGAGIVVPLRGFFGTPIPRDRVRNVIATWHARVLVAAVLFTLALLVAGFGHELTWFLFDSSSGTLPRAVREGGGWFAVLVSAGSGLFTVVRAGPTSAGTDAQESVPGLATRLVIGVAPILVLALLVVGAATLGHWAFAHLPVMNPLSPGGLGNTRAVVVAALIGVGLVILFAMYERWKTAPRQPSWSANPIEPTMTVRTSTAVRSIPGFLASSRGFVITASALVLLSLGTITRVRPQWIDAIPRPAVLGALAVAVLFAVLRLCTTTIDRRLRTIATRRFARGVVAAQDAARIRSARENVNAAQVMATEAALAKANTEEGSPEREAAIDDGKKAAADLALAGTTLRVTVAASYVHRLASLISPILVVLIVATAIGVWLWSGVLSTADDATPQPLILAARLAIVGLLFATTFVVLDFGLSREECDRSVALVALAAMACGSLIILHYLPATYSATGFATFGVAMALFCLTSVIGLGWMADPNLLALHNFYKSRLVRAYLGASNASNRHGTEITEVAPDDDVLLKDMTNYARGGPVHVINTTLNLVGGRDLSTAQRFAAPFTMSSEVCGSARTGYHRTTQYMGGMMSLGTAVAASGAAVSTNMGSKSVSSALALLLALFNVRLGIWAPTPSKGRWYEPQARLWPFYLVREALSQTTDLGTYCYLTDGGHFDNTGVYALIERGCRYILVLDSGADAQPCFSDMGEAIRRCRIDFGAEIDLTSGVERFIKAKDGGYTKVHYVRGTIHYAKTHLKMLGWSDDQIRDKSSGTIVWVKPAVTKKDSVDIQQYKLENAVFPQQTTADQWYDESQFESYRALGYQALTSRLTDMKELEDAVFPKPYNFDMIDDFFGRL